MIDKDFDLVKSFDEIKGPDIISLKYDVTSYFGFIDKSPIEQRLVENFEYLNTYNNYTKPYRAHWMIYDSKLLLGYCNGIINGKRLYTTDIFPEFAGNDLLHFFDLFSGELLFSPITFDTFQVKNIKYKGENMTLHLEKGVLIKAEYSQMAI